jgi:hypothetical protein
MLNKQLFLVTFFSICFFYYAELNWLNSVSTVWQPLFVSVIINTKLIKICKGKYLSCPLYNLEIRWISQKFFKLKKLLLENYNTYLLKNVTRIKVLFCLFLYIGEVCYLIRQTPCNCINLYRFMFTTTLVVNGNFINGVVIRPNVFI